MRPDSNECAILCIELVRPALKKEDPHTR